mgnify:CR=1 FL=1
MTTAEAIAHFNAGTKLYPLYGQAHVTTIERIDNNLVKIELSSGSSGLHSSANLTTREPKKPVKRDMRSFIKALTPRP